MLSKIGKIIGGIKTTIPFHHAHCTRIARTLHAKKQRFEDAKMCV